MTKKIGILTAGSDCPGMNAAIRAIGKAARAEGNMEIIGFRDGFLGLLQDETFDFESSSLSGILTAGGTILGTSRDVPHAFQENGKTVDRLDQAVEVYHRHKLSALICIGGRETQDAAFHLTGKGLNVITLPKAVDNDLAETDTAIGFDTALNIAAEAIDRLHSTANSNHRIIIVEITGRKTGWLTLGAGVSGGADVVLIPEIAYDMQKVADAILERNRAGKRFSILAVAQGAMPQEFREFYQRSRETNAMLRNGEERNRIDAQLVELESRTTDNTSLLSNRLESFTGIPTRVTILGYLIRGGIPSGNDRLLATQLGTDAVNFVSKGNFGVMLAIKNGQIQPVPLAKVQDCHKLVPANHHWIQSARQVGVAFGD